VINMRWVLLLVSLSMLLNEANAKEFIPRLGLSVEQNDNIYKTKEGAEQDTVVTPYFGFIYEDQGSQLDASIDFEIRNERYLNNSPNNQNLFSANSFLDWIIVPNRFVWAFEDMANTQRITAFEAAKPSNIQNFNVFTTGPDFIFSDGSYEGLLKLRVGDVYYSDTGADNQRLIGSASAKRLINEYSSLGLKAAVSLVDFEEVFRVDYDIGFMGAAYERELPYGTFQITTGFNWVNHDNGIEENAPMGELEFEYDNGANVLRLAASSKYSDPALEAYDPLYSRQYDVGVGKPVNANEVSGVEVVDSNRAEASYTREGARVKATVLGYLENREPLLGNPASYLEQVGYNVGLAYQLRDNLSLWVGHNASDNDFTKKNSYVKSVSTSVGVNYNISQYLKLTVGASVGEDSSDDPKRDFSNDIVFLRIEYSGASKERE